MFLTLVPGETLWGRKGSCLRWEGGSCYRSMRWSVLMGSVRREELRECGGWCAQGGVQNTEMQTQQEMGDASHPPCLSPPGSVISCRTHPSQGLRFSTCPKGVIYPLSLPHRLLLRCNKIIALRLLLSTINIGNFYEEQFLLTAKL